MVVTVENPDIYIVTDTKEQQQANILSVMIKEAEQRRNPKLLQRIILQIYDQPMLKTVQGVYEFPSIIYTLYASKDTDQEVIDFVRAESHYRRYYARESHER
ncbi:hypothetical protein [Paenibacillus glacialis]|uniref:Uncharacterized protein n=1 Tax=Paenibacillus glacialis TaxID=494026 RepID=A0A168L873_9BACL|nr:hypothetical protein [Paenibacillus glacialis]OAB43011.1 hypothetical protein PGLA_11220 [Paenibacillus glacialis]